MSLANEAAELSTKGERARAEDLFRRATGADPHLAGAWVGLGLELKNRGESAEAHQCFLRTIAEADRAVRKNPNDRPAHIARCMANVVLFRPAEAVRSGRCALALAPEAKLHSELLFLMNSLPETTPEALYEEACRWNSLYAPALPAAPGPYLNLPDPGRRLKIGYVSPDLFEHPIMKFLPPVLEFHNRSQFSVTAYSVGRNLDTRTVEVSKLADTFVACPESGEALEERIRADRIDILVDLAGHTMPLEYFLVFARKPAPIQVSWLGLLCTTGLRTMDYYIGDREVPCPGTEHCFTETVYRLPRAPWCYRPAVDAAVVPSPCLERGFVTFGSFNSPNKIGRDVVRIWAEILRGVAGSRLMLKYWGMDTEAARERYQGWFAREGIHRDRLHFEGPTEVSRYLSAYAEIDIALDPFPYQGGSTTLDTLLMGVPLVALAGRLAVQCSTSSILKSMGLAEMVTASPEEYVKAAAFLAGIVGKIPGIRHNIRKAFQASPFMDERGFTGDLEAAYRDMWRSWCAKQGGVTAAPARE